MTEAILVLNVGSSSIKFAVFGASTGEPGLIHRGAIERIGSGPCLTSDTGLPVQNFGSLTAADDHVTLMERLVAWLEDALNGCRVIVAGHRIVHGGRDFAAPVVIDDDVLAKLEALVPLAPHHQPNNIAGIKAVAAARPDLRQVACFDTAFHRTQPRLAQLFAIPRRLTDEGIIRYGFHGLSYEHVSSILPSRAGALADGRVVVAHLGHGASLCAMRKRKSVATSMGFTTLDGLVMGTRPGALDPGIVLHLLRNKGMSADQVEGLLYNESGLLGVSELSDDMRSLLASDDERAGEAVDLFVHSAVREIGALVAVLGGLDVLVFTAGIGENSPEVRERIATGLGWLGLRLATGGDATRISAPDSAVEVFVIPADEERVIACHSRKLCQSFPLHPARGRSV